MLVNTVACTVYTVQYCTAEMEMCSAEKRDFFYISAFKYKNIDLRKKVVMDHLCRLYNIDFYTLMLFDYIF